MEIKENLVTLKKLDQHHLADYLNNFSQKVQSILSVPSLQEEKRYIQQRLQKQQEGKTFFFAFLIMKRVNLSVQ